MPYEALLAETIPLRGHNGDQIDGATSPGPLASASPPAW